MFRSNVFLVATVAAAVSFAGCGSSSAKRTLTRSFALDGAEAAVLQIESSNGSIRIDEDPDVEEMIVVGTVTAGGSDESEAIQRLGDFDMNIEQVDSEGWTISSVMPESSRGTDEIRFVVTVPRIGMASVRSGNGAITIPSSHGDLELETGNGSIKVGGANGRVIGKTGNGSILCELVGPEFSSQVDLKTGNGRIRIMLPLDCVGSLSAGTGFGSIDHPGLHGMEIKDHFPGSMSVSGDGGGKASIVLATGNGSIQIQARDEEDPAGSS